MAEATGARHALAPGGAKMELIEREIAGRRAHALVYGW